MNKPRAPLSVAFPSKGSAAPKPDVAEVQEEPPHPAPESAPTASLKLEPKRKNEYAALTIRPGPERRKRLERVAAETGHSMQDILLACFDAFYPPS